MATDHDESTAFIAAIEHEQFVHAVNDQAALFNATRNGLTVWRAFLLAREAGKPVPEPVLEFLEQIGRDLLAAKTSPQVLTALRMNPRVKMSAHSHLKQADRAFTIVSAVEQLKTLPGKPAMSHNKACRRVGERYGMTQGAVRAICLRWGKSRPSKASAQRRGPASAFDYAGWIRAAG